MPHAIHHPEHALALYSAAQSRQIEQTLQAVLPAHTLMERAGMALARLALALSTGRQGCIWLLCGPGNNGGDGLVAARLLHLAGIPVRVQLVEAPERRPHDAEQALRAAQKAGVPIEQGGDSAPAACRLAVDALLGLGLRRAPSGAMAAAIAALNRLQSIPVLAADLPSGLLADSGALAGDTAVQAQHCLSLLTLKPGLFTAQGRAHSGQIWFDELGSSRDAGVAALRLRPQAWLLGRDVWQNWRGKASASPALSHGLHKGSQGDVHILGGASGMQGAARLAARAALAAGAGRVHVSLLDEGEHPASELDSQRAELMRIGLQRLLDPGHWQQQVLVCGCGGGSALQPHLATLLPLAPRLVLDADGLNAVAEDPQLRDLLRQRESLGRLTVLTPHPLEAARLLNCSVSELQSDRLHAAGELASQLRCTVVLKGSGSVIASADREQPPLINSSGCAALATAGSGDVLAGWLGGMWAQRPLHSAEALASAAVFWHGLAGESQAAGPLRAADLVERMHALHPAR